ncbi:MAG: TPM domain-containing protein, partial [Candidatus Dormibacteria bacterium]
NRAGVLFLVVPSRHQFAVYGDEVAHTRLGDAAWLHVAELVEERLRAGDATGALERGIAEVAAQLAAHDSAAN